MSSERDATAVGAHSTPQERAARGRAARSATPRASHAAWNPQPGRLDPVELLVRQATTRVPELVPVRHTRMLTSPFAFYRGGAAIMAADVATTPQSGLRVQCCGDARLANFGGFASPERALVFDINDFDETLPGPWEWDVKRLATSFEIAARALELDVTHGSSAVTGTVRAYREGMREFAGMRNLEVWYAHLDVAGILARWRGDVSAKRARRFERSVLRAESRDSLKAFAKLTRRVGGALRIASDPPLLVPLDEVADGPTAERIRSDLHARLHAYRRTLQPDRRALLDRYRLVDLARKVVGVGSVGTRTWIALMLGRDEDDPLFLQIKEAEASVLEPFAGKTGFANDGQRVVEGQRSMQAASDIFLGWDRAVGLDGASHDFYVRQLWDWKYAPSVDAMSPEVLRVYGEMCGWTLARAHARTGDPVAIAAYLGAGDGFDRALVQFASAYAEQNQRDYEAAVGAARAGRLPVERAAVTAG